MVAIAAAALPSAAAIASLAPCRIDALDLEPGQESRLIRRDQQVAPVTRLHDRGSDTPAQENAGGALRGRGDAPL